jgi:hypothetical protein
MNIQMAGTSSNTQKTAVLEHPAAEPSVKLYASAWQINLAAFPCQDGFAYYRAVEFNSSSQFLTLGIN